MRGYWEDKFIFGSRGYWYIVVGEYQVGYFYTLKAARKYVRSLAS